MNCIKFNKRFRFAPLRTDQIISRLTHVAETEGVNITEAGTAALLQLAGGDMRRVLNLLQATHLSYETVDEEVVYLTAGAAVPKVIEQMFN